MKIYSCWHAGLFGYTCRSIGKTWVFVPEEGQSNDQIRENLGLDDLIFQNKVDKDKEREIEERISLHNEQIESSAQNHFNLKRFSELIGISD